MFKYFGSIHINKMNVPFSIGDGSENTIFH